TDRRAGRIRQRGCRRLSQRAGRVGGPNLKPAAGTANRLRSLVCAVDADWRGTGDCGDPGGAAVVTNVPWLSVLWLVPLAGLILIILLPPGLRQVAKWTGVAVSVVTLAVAIVVATGFKTGGAPYQFLENHPWIPAFGA